MDGTTWPRRNIPFCRNIPARAAAEKVFSAGSRRQNIPTGRGKYFPWSVAKKYGRSVVSKVNITC